MKTKRKHSKKGLQKGKKIEAKKALFMGLQQPAPQPYLKIQLNDLTVSSITGPVK
jgi:hypothetical protein